MANLSLREQLALFSTAKFPSTRYQGSKAKIAGWIWDHISELSFHTCLDAFGGTGAVAHLLKSKGKSVTYNDRLSFNYQIGKALIENKNTKLSRDDIDFILMEHSNIEYPTFVQDTFRGIYFTDEENAWIDRTITNLAQLEDPYKYALGFFSLAQACIVKRPFNLFHRKNLYIRFAKVERSFGNKASWDKPFADWFKAFAFEANDAVFDNGEENFALCLDAIEVNGEFDFVYIDTPYISGRGVGVDFRDFYHFLEGLTNYGDWGDLIDFSSKHLRLKRDQDDWSDKRRIHSAFDNLFRRFRKSKIAVSYRTDGMPSIDELEELLSRYKKNVKVVNSGKYKYVLSTNAKSKEALLLGY